MVSELFVRTYTKGPHWLISIHWLICITHGVPQGAILSLFLFCIYANDLPSVTQVCDLDFFVDDSKILLSFSIEDVVDAKHNLENDLCHVASWCCENELLNQPCENQVPIVGTRQLKTLPEDMSLTFLRNTIIPVPYAKDLGVTFDSHLTFDKHIGDLIFRSYLRVKHCFDRNTLTNIISTLVLIK
jgi:hypothetical protein